VGQRVEDVGDRDDAPADRDRLPGQPRGVAAAVPPLWCERAISSAISTSAKGLPESIRAPIVVWVLTCSNSASVSLPGLESRASGIAILPTSCSGASPAVHIAVFSRAHEGST